MGWFAPWLVLVALAGGCGRSDIHVYRIPKEDPWKLPAGWEVREPGAMRVARFAVPGPGGRETDVSLIPLKGMPGSRADVLNIWRQQLRLEPLDEEALAKMAEKVSINSAGGELFDMVGTDAVEGSNARPRTLLATVKNDNTTWFIKMTGDDEQVRREKPVFISFLKTLNLDAMPAPAPARPRPEATSAETPHAPAVARPEWSVPPGWQEQPPSPMLLARFQVAGGDGAKADVNITVLDGDGGGMSENVNRWRRQLGLPPVAEGELNKLLTPLDVHGGKAMLVDMSGTDAKTRQSARLIGAIVPREDRTWFYKLMGNEQLAEREKAAFIKFFQTAKYPNG